MCAGDMQRHAVGDEGFVDIFRTKSHVGAVIAVKEQGEGLPILDTEDGERRHPLRIDLDLRNVTAFVNQRFDEKAPHLLIADAGNHRAT